MQATTLAWRLTSDGCMLSTNCWTRLTTDAMSTADDSTCNKQDHIWKIIAGVLYHARLRVRWPHRLLSTHTIVYTYSPVFSRPRLCCHLVFVGRGICYHNVCPSVCLSILRPSVTLASRVYTVQGIEILAPYGGATCFYYSEFFAPHFVALNLRVYPNECIEQRHPLLTAEIRPIIRDILKTVRDICKLLLFTKKKSHKGFSLEPKSLILNDPKRRNGRYWCMPSRRNR